MTRPRHLGLSENIQQAYLLITSGPDILGLAGYEATDRRLILLAGRNQAIVGYAPETAAEGLLLFNSDNVDRYIFTDCLGQYRFIER